MEFVEFALRFLVWIVLELWDLPASLRGRPPLSVRVLCAYAGLGALIGVLSLWVIPRPLLSSEVLRVVSLGIVPLGVGLMTAFVGAWRTREGQPVTSLDQFTPSAVLVATLLLVRHAGLS